MTTKQVRITERFATDILEQSTNLLAVSDPFKLSKAQIFGFMKKPNGELIYTGHAEMGDLYMLLMNDNVLDLANRSEVICLMTCGWAAPIRDDNSHIPPSEDRARRQVFLSVVASRNSFGSFIKFRDNPEDNLYTKGGEGQMVTAIKRMFNDAAKVN